uniref:Uncharacterized protein n=1 Tax=Falco tinnunculus TaxID=100819 RepID=A0A8C4U994_FALTI
MVALYVLMERCPAGRKPAGRLVPTPAQTVTEAVCRVGVSAAVPLGDTSCGFLLFPQYPKEQSISEAL